MKIGFTELILVVIVAFVVIGPDKLPEYARKFERVVVEQGVYCPFLVPYCVVLQ